MNLHIHARLSPRGRALLVRRVVDEGLRIEEAAHAAGVSVRTASWHHHPVLSFIVPAHNEARLLGATLDALHAAAGGVGERYELIVVDDDSTDATAAIARQHAALVLPVSHRHIAATRNAGARVAAGEILFFVDADTVIDAAVVAAALRALRAGVAGGGAAVGWRGDVAAHERWAAKFFAWLFRILRIAPGCFIFCSRAAFDAAGGFDQAYYAGEDVAISRALARQGRFVILRHTVMTSARKLRTFSLAEHLRLVARFLVGGRRVLASRHDLALWYGERRDEPQRTGRTRDPALIADCHAGTSVDRDARR